MTGELDFIPLGDRIVILPDEAPGERMTEGGVLLLEDSSQETTTGTIVSMGMEASSPQYDSGLELEDGTPVSYYNLVVGDRVVFSPWTGHAIVLNGTLYKIVTSADIMGIIPSGVTVGVE